MPNLDYDPQNPTDLLDRPIAVGDIVAWGTTFGCSPAIAVCRIERIRFLKKNPAYPHSYSASEFIEGEQWEAEKYQLVLLPIKSTGSVTNSEFVTGGFPDPDGRVSYFRKLPKAKTKTIHLVKNVVKIGEPL